MKENAINWDLILEIITKDQLYKICHISKNGTVFAQKRKDTVRIQRQENAML